MSFELQPYTTESEVWSFPSEKYWKPPTSAIQHRTRSSCNLCVVSLYSIVTLVLIHSCTSRQFSFLFFFAEIGKYSREILFTNDLQVECALTLISKLTAHTVLGCFPSYDPPVALSLPSAISSVFTVYWLFPSDLGKQPRTMRGRGRWPNGALPSLTPMNSASKWLFCWFVCPF